jgi:hypothetical protein
LLLSGVGELRSLIVLVIGILPIAVGVRIEMHGDYSGVPAGRGAQ